MRLLHVRMGFQLFESMQRVRKRVPQPMSEEALLELLQKLVRTAYNEGRDGTPWAKSKARQATRRMEFLKNGQRAESNS